MINNAHFACSYLYQIAHLGDDDEEPEFSSAMPLELGDTFFFAPRQLRNLVLVDELESLSPILDAKICDLANEDTPQLYAACGRGPRSSLRVLRHGLEVTEMAVSELPGNPNAVWTVKTRADGKEVVYPGRVLCPSRLVRLLSMLPSKKGESWPHGTICRLNGLPAQK